MIKFNFVYFIFSFFIGIFFIYLTTPKPQVIVKYPTLENSNDTIYIDESNICYKYIPKEIDCEENN